MECSSNTLIHSKSCDMDDKIQIKEEPLHYNEISSRLEESPGPRNEIYFEMLPEKSELICDTKVDIKQEPCHLNETAADIKSGLQELPISDLDSSMNTVVIKAEDIKMGIKEETSWHDTSTQESDSNKYEGSENILSLESQRLAKKSVYTDTDEDNSYNPVCGNNSTSMRQNISCNSKSDSDLCESSQNQNVETAQVYRCENCKKCDPTLNMKKMSGPKQHKCEVCDKCFTRKSTLECHKLLHTGLKPFRCDICETFFTQKSALYRHKLLHSGTKPYTCDICKKCFTRKSSLKTHKFHHSGTKPYKCDTCDKYFTQKSDLRNHKLLHSGTKPYQCDMCEKRFTRRSRLLSHKLIHSGTTPYKCEICKKCFNWKSDLQRHALLHSGTKPHKCDVCQKRFTQKSSLLRHALQHLTKKPCK